MQHGDPFRSGRTHLEHHLTAASPHRLATKQWAARKSMAAFEEVGFLDGRARKIWQQAGFLAPGAA